jgi:acetyl-CoA C-acetyltransferase
MHAEKTPVIVGAAQWTQREVDPASAPSPLDALEVVARGAVDDGHGGPAALAELDTVALVRSMAGGIRNLPAALGERLGATPRRGLVSAIGGEMALVLVDHVAEEIRAGRARSVLVAGTHNMRTAAKAQKQGVALDWKLDAASDPELFGVDRAGSSPREDAAGLDRPTNIYPLFENALRAHRGLDIDAHRKRVGALMSRFSEVAAANPHAWFPTARSADEITLATPENRMISFPYTKYMNAVMQTDQAAAVWITSLAAARAYGVPEEQIVHLRGGAAARERAWFPSERPRFAACPALQQAASSALARSGTTLGEVDFIDFYSCFPVAVEMACEMLGLDETDPRNFTVTGGLPYGGGPGNNYTLHSLATMVGKVREKQGSLGLVTGNGWYLTKHSAVVLGTEPCEKSHGAPVVPQPEGVSVGADQTGAAEVLTYTVLYGRDGAPERGIVVGEVEGGGRFVANTPDDRTLLADFVAEERIGTRGRVRPEKGGHLFEPR